MKRPNITPGPWEAQGCFNEIVATQPNAMIAAINRANPVIDSKANARAISAVPQLLEALEDALKRSQDVPALYRDWPFIQKARAALSAAGYGL